MAYRSWQEISPWDQEGASFDMRTIRKQPINVFNKHNSIMMQTKKESKICSVKQKLRCQTVPRTIQSCKEIKMINYAKIRNRSSIQELGGQCIKVKTQSVQPLNYGKCLSIRPDQICQFSSGFTVKKYNRIKNFERSIYKQQKIQEIFRKMYDIQNPVQRRNYNLPKIEVKL